MIHQRTRGMTKSRARSRSETASKMGVQSRRGPGFNPPPPNYFSVGH
jgi:hypothetical protein